MDMKIYGGYREMNICLLRYKYKYKDPISFVVNEE